MRHSYEELAASNVARCHEAQTRISRAAQPQAARKDQAMTHRPFEGRVIRA